MRYRWLATTLVLMVCLAMAQHSPVEPDAGAATNNTFRSEFFKFHYGFPQGWSALNDGFRTADNRKRHEDQVKTGLAKLPPDTENTKHKFKVFWMYDLLIATPQPLAAGEKAGLPHVSIWAFERSSAFNESGDYAKNLSMLPAATVLRKAEEVKFSGRKFTRADFSFRGNNFEALFVTVSGKYLIGFEFRGNSEKEMNDLAQTMQALKFD